MRGFSDGRADSLQAQHQEIPMTTHTIRTLDLGIVPEAAVSGPVLVATDDFTLLSFNAKRLEGEQRVDAGTALLEFERCLISKFGYPNDEALSGHPLIGTTPKTCYRILEVVDSPWPAQLAAQNRIAFPHTSDWHIRHFIVTFHDSTFECLAHEVKVRVFPGPYADVWAEITKRIQTY
jgi:hypothetical protein